MMGRKIFADLEVFGIADASDNLIRNIRLSGFAFDADHAANRRPSA
jgi:hypothetical protein